MKKCATQKPVARCTETEPPRGSITSEEAHKPKRRGDLSPTANNAGVVALFKFLLQLAKAGLCAMSWIRRCSIVLVSSLVSSITREAAFIGRALPRTTACRYRSGRAGMVEVDPTEDVLCGQSWYAWGVMAWRAKHWVVASLYPSLARVCTHVGASLQYLCVRKQMALATAVAWLLCCTALVA